MTKKKTIKNNVYTVYYTLNKKDKYINIVAESEEAARKYFNDIQIPIFYEEFLKRYQIELLRDFDKRFELLSVNKNTAYSK